MTRAHAARLALALVLVAGVARRAATQRASALPVAVSSAASITSSTPRPPAMPSDRALALQTLGGSAMFAAAGAAAGLLVDDASCRRTHRDEEGVIFGPCAFYAAAPTAVGWFGGGIAGATWKAASVARERGCPRSAAWWRALGGAALGAAPGALAALGAHGDFPPSRTALVFTAPLVTSAGAALAVRGCRGR